MRLSSFRIVLPVVFITTILGDGLVFGMEPNQVLLVCRLDGPDPATVCRIINDTLLVEKKGLHGKAYFDAR